MVRYEMSKGFTLMEVLIVISIIGILAAIVIPMIGEDSNKPACPTCGRPY